MSSYLDLVLGAAGSLRHLRLGPVRRVFYKQVYFTGIEAIPPVSFAGILLGLAIITQMRSILGTGVALNVKVIDLLVVREFATLFTAIIVLGRSGSAIATELASMKQRGEVKALYQMGIDPGVYLLLPRIVGVCLSVVTLTFYFQFMAVVGGLGLASLLGGFNLGQHLGMFFSSIHLRELWLSAAKSFCFALIIAAVPCHHGIHASSSATNIPQCAEIAMVRGFALVLVVDVLFALCFL